MDESMRNGMLLAGALLSAIPISLGIGIGVYVLRRHLASRGAGEGAGRAEPGASPDG